MLRTDPAAAADPPRAEFGVAQGVLAKVFGGAVVDLASLELFRPPGVRLENQRPVDGTYHRLRRGERLGGP